MISVINIGLGNFASVANILKKKGFKVLIESCYDKISRSKIIILPGVGRFDVFMETLNKLKIDKAIKNAIENNSKILGICVGMHVLLDFSEEGNAEGLKIISGKVKKFNFENSNLKIPHMGWNKIEIVNDNEKIVQNSINSKFYFVHSYYVETKNISNVIAKTNYGFDFASIIKKKNVYGVQFHPEKSHLYGYKFLKSFLDA